MRNIELKFLLTLLRYKNYRTVLSKIRPNSKIRASERDSICQNLLKAGFIDSVKKISKIKITALGIKLLNSEKGKNHLLKQELKILKACQNQSITLNKIKIASVTIKQTIIEKLVNQELISYETKIKEVWLTDKGQKYLAKEYNPSGAGNITLSKKMLKNYLDFLRNYWADDLHIATEQKTLDKPDDNQILQIVIDLDKENSTNNYLPIFHLRNKLQPPLSREELDQALYRLQASDKIELSTLAEVEAYTPEEIDSGISQIVGGSLFYITVTVN